MLNIRAPIPLNYWVARLGSESIPVLRQSVDTLHELMQREDEVVARELSNVILRDPMLTLQVLRTLQTLHPNRQITDITTIEHGVMMMGVTPFFRQFKNLPVVEDELAGNPVALHGVMKVVMRARHAALHAKNWATLLGDVESDEVVIAALLHDMAELLIWFFAPQLAFEITCRMKADPALRSGAAQQAVLGVRLSELQLALCQEWGLPGLLQSLMDEYHAHRPRARNALLAVAFARHSAHGWWDAALPDDLNGIEGLLALPGDEVRKIVYWVELSAIANQQGYAAIIGATWLPPGPSFFHKHFNSQSGDLHGFDSEELEQTLQYLSIPATAGRAMTSDLLHVTARDIRAIDTMACAMNGIRLALGFDRVLFLDEVDGDTLPAPRYIVGGRRAGGLPELHLSAPDGSGLKELLSSLHEATDLALVRGTLASLLPTPASGSNPAEDFMAMPLFNASLRRWGLIYADCRSSYTGEDGEEEIFAQFRNIVVAAELRLDSDHTGRAEFK